MLKIGLALLTAATALATPAAAQQRAIGQETVIPFAANGGLRNWEAGPARSNLVYVQDRRLRWYKVEMTGPCVRTRDYSALQYKTDLSGNFDRFSRVWSIRYPNAVCGVVSVKHSLPPKGQPGHRASR